MKKIKLNTKIIDCLKCKKEFETELDSSGIPYKKICPSCKKNTGQRFNRGILSSVY